LLEAVVAKVYALFQLADVSLSTVKSDEAVVAKVYALFQLAELSLTNVLEPDKP
jgi:hypothetical protein